MNRHIKINTRYDARVWSSWRCHFVPAAAALIQLRGYVGERRGEREDMQDAHTIIDNLTPPCGTLPNDMYVSCAFELRKFCYL